MGGFGCPVSPYNNTSPYMQELIVRWYQFGVVSPIFRTHCDHCELRPWLFSNFEELAPVYRLRNALVPCEIKS